MNEKLLFPSVATIVGIALAAAIWSLGSDRGIASHYSSSEFAMISRLNPANNDIVDRIYSGRREDVVLTLKLHTALGGSLEPIELLVNGAQIPDGSLHGGDEDTRTFKLRDVKTLDVRLLGKGPADVLYTISVLL